MATKKQNTETIEATEITLVEEEQVSSLPATQEAPTGITPIVQYAIQERVPVDQLKELVEMQRDSERYEAEKAFNLAMSKFRANAPTISKDGHVHYEGNKGITDYKHATLGNVVKTISEALAKEGLSHRWIQKQPERGVIEVTCYLTHALGHSEKTSMSCGYDASGGKNEVQSIGSAKTYLERYTLLGITGCATEEDDDGEAAGQVSRLHITDEQLEFIEGLIEAAGNTIDIGRFLSNYNVMEVSELQQRDYHEAVAMLEIRVKKNSQGAK